MSQWQKKRLQPEAHTYLLASSFQSLRTEVFIVQVLGHLLQVLHVCSGRCKGPLNTLSFLPKGRKTPFHLLFLFYILDVSTGKIILTDHACHKSSQGSAFMLLVFKLYFSASHQYSSKTQSMLSPSCSPVTLQELFIPVSAALEDLGKVIQKDSLIPEVFLEF